MSVVYSLYDALVSINVPDEKAKAVIDAMEREMMDKLATKGDVENLRLASKSDFIHLQEVLSKDIQAAELRMELRISDLKQDLTVRLGVLMAALIGAATALIGAVQYFH